MKIKVFIAGIIVIIAIVIFDIFFQANTQAPIASTPTPTPTPLVHLHANFIIVTNGTVREFTDTKYQYKSKEVFMKPKEPTSVHVEASNVTWDDFFKTLPMKLTSSCLTTGTGQVFCNGENGQLRFFLNGTPTPDALTKLINDKDELLVTFGNESEEEIYRNQINLVP